MTAGLITEQDPNKQDSARALANLDKKFQSEQDLLDKALKKKAISEQEYRDDSLKLELDYQAQMADIRQQYRGDFLSDTQAAWEGFLGVQLDYQNKSLAEQGQSFAQTLQMGAQHNKALFQLQKVAAIAQAVLKARQSVVDAYQWGSSWGGPPAGYAMAGIAAAAQAANIAAIASASFGGGGSSVSSGGGGGGSSSSSSATSVATVPAAQQPQEIRIVVEGNDADTWLMNAKTMRNIVDGLNDAIKGGKTLVTVGAS
jgi:hypothetical protein